MGASPLSKYQELEVLTMSRERLVVFLYSALHANLAQARALLDGDVSARTHRILKAQDVLNELLASLDLEAGGELAARLQRIYGWMMVELLEIQARRDAHRLDRVIAMVRELHEAWSRAADELEAQPAASAP
ncbi:MAG TPA: flagellar export chaperone FliS [Gemmatimonadales bacterium]|nr:flagellar export chaperone FliS [Gemmatimonadales bacterium]